LVHLTSDSAEELFVIDLAVVVLVKHVEKSLVLVVRQVDTEITEGFHGFSVREVSTSVNVCNSEGSTDTGNSTGATLG
jgi:hypothetical protein